MSKKDPAFLFYPEKFLTGIMFLTNEQVGIYIKLLCVQHQHGGLIDKDSFNNMVGESLLLRKKFIETSDGFYNEKLTEEMQKRNIKSNNLSDAAKDVWKNRKMKLHEENEQKEYNSNTIVSNNDSIVIRPLNINIDINNKDILDSIYTNNINKNDEEKNSEFNPNKQIPENLDNSVGSETIVVVDIQKELLKSENEYHLKNEYLSNGKDFNDHKRDLKDIHAWLIKNSKYPINRKQSFAHLHTWLSSSYYKGNGSNLNKVTLPPTRFRKAVDD